MDFRTVNFKGGKSMKKFLSLVLALVMTMSLVTISAGATSFTDDSSIDYDEAIEVMQALKVIDGYGDGSFRPDTALNRGQAAKIICNLILGPTTAAALPVTSAPFSDVPADSTFAGYIAFCAKEGIINGYTDGTFRPAGQLTGYAYLKMLLGALGYDPEIEGYTGVANWGINVAKQAIGIGLVDGNDDFAGTQTVTRQEACLYALNTLQATMVDYDSKTTVTVNGAAVVIGNSNAYEMTNSAKTEKINDDGKLQFAEKYFTDLKLNDDATDDFGRPSNKWTLKNTEIGTFAQTPDATYTTDVKGKAMYNDLGDSYDVNEYYVNGEVATPVSGFAIARNNDTKLAKKVNGVQTEVYLVDDNGTDKAVIVSIETFLAQVSGDYDEDKGELTLIDADGDDVDSLHDAIAAVPGITNADDEMVLSDDDFDNLSSFADEDYVLVTMASGVIKSIVKAETVTGTVTNYEDQANVTVNGTKYEYSKHYNGTKGNTTTDYSIDDEYTLYLDQYGYVIFADGVEAEQNYVFIDDFYANSGSSKSAVKANAYFLDGTDGEITINKVDGTSYKGASDATTLKTANPNGAWFSYSLKSDGKYDLKNAIASSISTSGNVTDKDSVNIKVTNSTVARGTKTTVFVVVDKDDNVKTYTGIKNVPQVSGTSVTVSVVPDSTTGYAKYVFIDAGATGTVKGGSSSSDVVFVYDASYDKRGTDKDSNVYYTYKAVLNGSTTKVKFDDGVGNQALPIMLFVDVDYDDQGYITSPTTVVAYDAECNLGVAGNDPDDYGYVMGMTNGAITQKSGVITFATGLGVGNVAFYVSDDVKIFVTDGTDIKTVGAKTLANTYTATDVFGVINSDGDYSTLFVVVNEDV
jgi:hypothetical protein